MFNNVAIDVFIGLIFVYLLYSLLATIVQEVIASTVNLRAVVLVKALRVMLEDRKPRSLQCASFWGRTFERIGNYIKNEKHYLTCHLPDATLAKAFYKHPGIKYLSSNILRTKPSYIHPENFSSTLVRVLRGRNYEGYVSQMQEIYNTLFPIATATLETSKISSVKVGLVDPLEATIQPETLDQLRQLYIDANKDIDRFKKLLEDWFNETMDRANGWYKRQTKKILFFIGLFIAIWGNVDTLKIYSILSKDKTAREQMVQMAIQSQQKYATAINNIKDTTAKKNDSALNQTLLGIVSGDSILNKTYNDVQNDIEKSNNILGMGWHASANYKKYDSLQTLQKWFKDSLKSNGKDTSLSNKLKVLSKQLDEAEATVYDKFNGFRSIIGWLITALALTLGAPFWFDLLNKFMSVRATGRRPKVDTDDSAEKTNRNITASRTGLVSKTSGTGLVEDDDQPELIPDEAPDADIAKG